MVSVFNAFRVMELKELLLETRKQLQEAMVPEPELEAEMLLSYGLNMKVPYIDYSIPIPEQNIKAIDLLVKRRKNREPLQYITNSVDFLGLTFFVDKSVFIPRPETENLVLESIRILKQIPKPIVYDIGTGSGVIAISIAKITNASVYASDICSLDVARKNSRALGTNVQFLEGNLFKPYRELPKADIICSNPPYIKRKDIAQIQPEIKEFEPMIAIDGGESGTYFISKLIRESPKWLKSKGTLICEIGYDEAGTTEKIANNYFENVAIKRDFNNIERILIARQPRGDKKTN